MLVSCEADGRRLRVAGDLAIRRVLGRAGLDDEAAGRVVDELHLGRAILLVEIAEVTPSEAQAQLEHVG